MAQSMIIRSLPQAFKIIKEMNLSDGRELDYRQAGRDALRSILEDRMTDYMSRYLEEMASFGISDRRNGIFSRHLLTELGDIELCVPRSRTKSAVEVIHAYGRRVGQVDRMILCCFVLGLSTRKVSQALLPVLGEPVSATTVSRVAKTLDRVVDAFHMGLMGSGQAILLLFQDKASINTCFRSLEHHFGGQNRCCKSSVALEVRTRRLVLLPAAHLLWHQASLWSVPQNISTSDSYDFQQKFLLMASVRDMPYMSRNVTALCSRHLLDFLRSIILVQNGRFKTQIALYYGRLSFKVKNLTWSDPMSCDR